VYVYMHVCVVVHNRADKNHAQSANANEGRLGPVQLKSGTVANSPLKAVAWGTQSCMLHSSRADDSEARMEQGLS
jgi:hypothetical protein